MRNPYKLALETAGIYLGWVEAARALSGSSMRRRWLQYCGGKSYMLFGSPGQGKYTTSQVYTELTCILSMIINSPKGESVYVSLPRRQAMGHECYVLNSFGLPDTPQVSMKTARINLLAGAGFNPDNPAFSDNIGVLGAATILPDGGQSFFTDGARKLTNGVTAFVCTLPPEDRNLVTVNEILQARDAEFLRYMQNLHDCGLDMARYAAAPYLAQEPPRDVWSVLSTASTQYGQLMEADGIKHVLSGNDFAWSDLKKRKVTVYIALPEAQAKTYYRFTRLLFASAFQALLTLPPVPVWFILDELATSLGDRSLDQIETAMSLGRAYGVALQTIFQSYAQAENIFGKAKAQAMVGSADILQFYTINDEASARIACARAGTKTEVELQGGGFDASQPRPTNGLTPPALWTPGERALGVPLYRPQDFYGLPRDKSILFKAGIANPIEAYRTPYYQIPALAALAADNPYAPKGGAV